MKIYKDVLVWVGGVLTGTVTQVTAAVLTPESKGHAAIALKQKFRSAENELALGQISAAQYCVKAIEISNAALTPRDLAHKLIEKFAVDHSAIETLAKIPPQYKIWFIVELPEEWYSELRARWKMDALFPASQILFTSSLGLTRIVPDIFYALPVAVHRSMADCIMLDADSHRAMESMHQGLASIIYVYPEQVRVQLALQGIYPTDADVMHPAAGGRAKI